MSEGWREVAKTAGSSFFLSFPCPECERNVVVLLSTPSHPSPIFEGQKVCDCGVFYDWKTSSSQPPLEDAVILALRDMVEKKFYEVMSKTTKLEIKRRS